MRSSIRMVATLALMFCFSAYGDTPDPVDPGEPPTSSTPIAIAGAAALSGSTSGAAAVNDVAVEVVGGDSTSSSGSASESRSRSGAESGSASVINYSQPRQVPPVFLPSLMVSECGAAGSAGASDKGGAGAFGVAWTTKRCYALRSAINFFAIGEYQTGCELLLYVNREAFKLIGKDKTPDCQLVAAGLHAESSANRDALRLGDPPVVVTPIAPKCNECATKEELERAFKKSNQK